MDKQAALQNLSLHAVFARAIARQITDYQEYGHPIDDWLRNLASHADFHLRRCREILKSDLDDHLSPQNRALVWSHYREVDGLVGKAVAFEVAHEREFSQDAVNQLHELTWFHHGVTLYLKCGKHTEAYELALSGFGKAIHQLSLILSEREPSKDSLRTACMATREVHCYGVGLAALSLRISRQSLEEAEKVLGRLLFHFQEFRVTPYWTNISDRRTEISDFLHGQSLLSVFESEDSERPVAPILAIRTSGLNNLGLRREVLSDEESENLAKGLEDENVYPEPDIADLVKTYNSPS